MAIRFIKPLDNVVCDSTILLLHPWTCLAVCKATAMAREWGLPRVAAAHRFQKLEQQMRSLRCQTRQPTALNVLHAIVKCC